MQAEESQVHEYPSLNEEDDDRQNFARIKTPVEMMKQVPKNSLDQDICSSLADEMKGICVKFSYVLIPRSQDANSHHLRNWDLWGPFIMCLIFAFFIDSTQSVTQTPIHFWCLSSRSLWALSLSPSTFEFWGVASRSFNLWPFWDTALLHCFWLS